jgi:hypothetical protein
VSRRRTPEPGKRTVCERIFSVVLERFVTEFDASIDDTGGPPLALVFNNKCWPLLAVDASILDDVNKVLLTPFVNEWSFIVDVIAAVVGRCCLSIDGRFSLSFVVDGRVLDETILDNNDEGVFDASVTPLLLLVVEPNWTSEEVSF